MGEDQSIFVMERVALPEQGRKKKHTAFEIVDKGQSTLPLPPSQMDFCVISNCSVLIYHRTSFAASIFMTFFFFLVKYEAFSFALSKIIPCHLRSLKNIVPHTYSKPFLSLLYFIQIQSEFERMWKI